MSKQQHIRDRFERIAEDYEHNAVLEQEVSRRLLERIAFCRYPPRRILDLGCGPGFASEKLKREFRKAQVLGLDFSSGMLKRYRRRSGLLRPLKAVCGDLGALPIADRCVDLVFSNLALPWCSEPAGLFAEIRRILRPGGLLLFSSFGPATMAELGEAAQPEEVADKAPPFADLLEIGDALMAAGFREPVMDREMITLTYRRAGQMMAELEATAKSFWIDGQVWGDNAPESLETALASAKRDGVYPLSFEIYYGTAFGPEEGQPVKTPEGDVATFSLEALKKSRVRDK